MRILLSFLIFFSTNFLFSQDNKYEYPFFPNDQHCYLGGFPQFYKDFHEIVFKEKLKPCEDKKEFYTAFVLINPDNSAEVLENNFSVKNRCSFNLMRKVAKHMDKWIPAKINNKEAATIARILLFPDALFENYVDGYDIGKFVATPKYGNSAGLNDFRNEVVKRIDMDRFYVKGNGTLKVLTEFLINENGEMTDLKIKQTSGLLEFDEMILFAIKGATKKQKFSPATIHGIPVKHHYIFPFSISSSRQ